MTYTVVKGDSLSAIAHKFNITLQELEAANPQITNPNDIKVGEVLNIPKQPEKQPEEQPETASLNDDQKHALQLHNAGISPVLIVSRPTYPFHSISYPHHDLNPITSSILRKTNPQPLQPANASPPALTSAGRH